MRFAAIASVMFLAFTTFRVDAAEGLTLTVGLADGRMIDGSDLIVVTPAGHETSLFDMGQLLPDKLLSVEPLASAIEVIPTPPSDTDHVRHGPFTAPNPFPGNTLRIPGGNPSEVPGRSLVFMVVHRADWEDRLDFLKAKYYGRDAAAMRAYLEKHPDGRANGRANEILGPTWGQEILDADPAVEDTREILTFLDNAFSYIPVRMQKEFPSYLADYISRHPDAELIAKYSSLFPDSPYLPQVQAIEGDRRLAELLKDNPGKSYGELRTQLVKLGNEFWASPELQLALARSYLESGSWVDSLRCFYLSLQRIERLKKSIPYGTAVRLDFINASTMPELAEEARRKLIEVLPLAIDEDADLRLTAVYTFAVQQAEKASGAYGMAGGALVAPGVGFNAYMLLVVRDPSGDIVSVRIASSEWYSSRPGNQSVLSVQDLHLALLDNLEETCATLAE